MKCVYVILIFMTIPSVCSRIMNVGFFFLFILVPFVLSPWNYELFEYNKMMLTYALTAVIVTSWIIHMIATKEIKIRRTPFDLPLGLFVLSQFVSTLFSMDPHISWFGYYSRFNGGMLSILSYVALYYAFVSSFSISQIFKLLSVTIGTAVVVGLYGVAERFGIDKNLWVQDVQSRVFSTLGQPNWLAAYLIALIPIPLGITMRYQNLNFKNQNAFWFLNFGFWIFTALLFFVVILFTRSRSGLLAFGVTQLVFLLLLFRPHIGKTPALLIEQMKRFPDIIKDNIRLRILTIVYCLMAIILFINGTHTMTFLDTYFSLAGWKTIIVNQSANWRTKIKNQNIQTNTAKTPETLTGTPNKTPEETGAVTGPALETGGTESGIIRKYVWQAAVNAWRSSTKTMLVGTGTETFAFAFYAFKPVGHNLTSEWDFLYNKAHNEYLNYLATTGIFGLGTYLFLIGSIIVWFFKILFRISNFAVPAGRQEFRIEDRSLFISLFVGWLSILITNFFGFSVVIVQILFFFIPALLVLLTEENRWYVKSLSFSKKFSQTSTAVIVGTGGIILILLTILWFADVSFATGYHLDRSGKIGPAFTYLTRAVTLNPLEPMYHDERGNTLASLALATQEGGDATNAGALARAAIAENDIAIGVSPNNINFWKTRTKILFTLSGIDEQFLPIARDALLRAQTLAPNDPKISYNLAIIEGRLGNADGAIKDLEKTIELKPNFRDGYYALSVFYTETGNKEKAKEVLESYLSTVDSADEQFKKLVAE